MSDPSPAVVPSAGEGGATAGTLTDRAIIDDALAAVEDARGQAPRDFLMALAIALVLATLVVLGVGIVVGAGIIQDVLLGLGVELLGVLITVVLIDGLWKRREAATTASLASTLSRLDARRSATMSAEERDAWRRFADDYADVRRAGSLVARLRHPASYGRRLTDLQRRAEETSRTSADASPVGATVVARACQGSAASSSSAGAWRPLWPNRQAKRRGRSIRAG